MAKVNLTRLELKRQREQLERYRRFLPALERRQQQLQVEVQRVDRVRDEVRRALADVRERFEEYEHLLRDRAGVDVQDMAAPQEVSVKQVNIAGVTVPVFEDIRFAEPEYSLFTTPPWVDSALADVREMNRLLAREEVLQERRTRLRKELIKVVQRVNLFEKVKIPEAEEAIHRIRIHLGDQMAAAVGRAKIAKARLSDEERGGGP